ncbi:MAG: translation initiation factor [Bacteroidota bacterium]|nr:translation initiation factor [Bacteroidota bacterium]
MSNKNKNKNGIVYSTNPDFEYDNNDFEEESLENHLQTLYVRKEVRSGKPSTVIKEFIGSKEDLKLLEKQLKNHCGTGGTSKAGDIIIQGDNTEKVKSFLHKAGYKTKG